MNMMKHVALLGLALAGVTAQAAHYTDVDQIAEADRLISRQNNRTDGFFNIVTGDNETVTIGAPYYTPDPVSFTDVAGFIPGHERVDAAFAWFYFRDNNNDNRVEAVRVDLDNTQFLLGGTSANPLTVIGNKSFSIFGGAATGAIQALEVDGILKYEINRVDGDFYFDYARLEVDTHVPDGGGTAMLLGLGVLAMGTLRRKLA